VEIRRTNAGVPRPNRPETFAPPRSDAAGGHGWLASQQTRLVVPFLSLSSYRDFFNEIHKLENCMYNRVQNGRRAETRIEVQGCRALTDIHLIVSRV